MMDKLRAKGREVLLSLTAAAMLLSLAVGVVGDMAMILVVGLVGWLLSQQQDK